MRIDVTGGRGRLATAAIAAGVLVPLAMAATASGAAAATLTVDRACYVLTDPLPPMTITGTGFVPGDDVEITDSLGGLNASGTADADGDVSIPTTAPDEGFAKPGTKTDTITATDATQAGTTITASTLTLLSPLEAATGKTRRATGLKAFTFKTRWSFSGFPENTTIYGHYLYHRKVVATQAFGKAIGPCGTLTVTRKVFPAKPRHRSYGLQVDSSRTYSTATSPKLTSTLSLSAF